LSERYPAVFKRHKKLWRPWPRFKSCPVSQQIPPHILALFSPAPLNCGPLADVETSPGLLLAPPHARIIVPQTGSGCPSRAQGGLLMPTERAKQAEKERVTRISGFR